MNWKILQTGIPQVIFEKFILEKLLLVLDIPEDGKLIIRNMRFLKDERYSADGGDVSTLSADYLFSTYLDEKNDREETEKLWSRAKTSVDKNRLKYNSQNGLVPIYTTAEVWYVVQDASGKDLDKGVKDISDIDIGFGLRLDP